MVIPTIHRDEKHTTFIYECKLIAVYDNHYDVLPYIAICFEQDRDKVTGKPPSDKIFKVNKESSFYKHAMSINSKGAKLLSLGIAE